MAKIIVPVGYPTGALYPVEGETEELEYSLILSREVMVNPPADHYRAWMLLFADPEAHRELRFTKEHAVKLAETAGIKDASNVYDQLEENQLLATFETDSQSSIQFLKEHQLIPQGVGLGNTKEDPTMFSIQLRGESVVSVMFDIYSLWMGSNTWPSMWKHLQDYAKYRTNAPISADQLTYLFAASVPSIVAAGAGFLMSAQ